MVLKCQNRLARVGRWLRTLALWMGVLGGSVTLASACREEMLPTEIELSVTGLIRGNVCRGVGRDNGRSLEVQHDGGHRRGEHAGEHHV